MKTCSLLIVLLFTGLVYAQLLKGTVVDDNQTALDGVTIALSRNENIVATALADHGTFSLRNLVEGKYLLTATLVGYKAVQREINFPKDTLQIIMKQEAKALQQVTISAAKPLIERKIDRVVFNVENSILASGGTVWDAVGKAPGVQTKFDGGITANNKDVVIYMDDKPLRLSGEDLATYLRNLPSDNVARIEIISNPTARYDAQGGAVINIISKKPKGQGLNVILGGGYTQTVYGSYNGSAVFNYRKNKLNIYGSYGYSKTKKDHQETEYVIYESPGSYSDWENSKSGTRSGEASSYKIGADYDLSKKQVIGFLLNGYNGSNARTNHVQTNIFNNHKPTVDSVLQTANSTIGATEQYSFNLNYKAKLDTSGQSLNIDLDYAPFRDNNNQYVDNLSFLPGGSLASAPYHIFTRSNQQINIYSGKLDYTYKLGKMWSLESGAKYSRIVTTNRFDFYDNTGAAPLRISNNSDDFEYAENISAAYTSITADWHKWSFQGGLRGEYTHTRGYSVMLEQVNLNSYFKLFPSLFLVYKINKDNELNLTYGSRINRADYWRLNPFKSYTSPYTYLQGNPALQPAFIYNIEMGYTYKQQYDITAYHRRTNGYFSNITVQDNVNKIFYDTQHNLDLSQETGIAASFPAKPTAWWEINNYLQGSYRQEKSGYLQSNYDYHALGLYASTNHAFTLNKAEGIKAEISAWYSSPTVQGIYHLAETYDLSAGIRKTVLNGQGTIRLAASDIFYSHAYRINVDYQNQRNGFYEKSDTRNVVLSFSYRLGSNVTAVRKRNTASEEEKKRAQ